MSAAAIITSVATDPVASRRMIVRKLCDLAVLPAGQLTVYERAIAADILISALDGCDVMQRREVAERLGPHSETPPALLRRLLLDGLEVAEPILAADRTLNDGLLNEAARTGGEEMRAFIARRPGLSPLIAETLIEFDEPHVLEALLANDTATFAPAAFDVLVARSRYQASLQPLLLKRPELEPVHAFTMFWWAGADLRRAILTRFCVDRRVLQEAFQDILRTPEFHQSADLVVKDVISLIDRRRRPRVKMGKAATPEAIRKTMDAARVRPSAELLQMLAQLSGAHKDTASRVLADPQGEALAVMSKALGVKRDGLTAMLSDSRVQTRMVAGDEENVIEIPQMTEEEIEAVVAVFDGLSYGHAQTLLRYWDWRSNPRLKSFAGIDELSHPPLTVDDLAS